MKTLIGIWIGLWLLSACTSPTVIPPTASPSTPVPTPATRTFANPTAVPTIELTPTPTIFPTPFAGTLTLRRYASFRLTCELGDPFDLPSKALEPLAFLPTGNCQNGEIGFFQIGDKNYVAQSGLFGAAYTLTDVTNPTSPQIVGVWDLGTLTRTLDLKPFHQGDRYYLGLALQGDRHQTPLPCGIVIVDVTSVRQPKLVNRLNGEVTGAPDPWCSVHTFEVDTDAQGNATFLIVSDVDTYSARAVDIRDLENPREVNFYHLHVHPHALPNQPVLNYVHDSYVAPDKIYLAYWLSGVVILDKQKFEAGLSQDPVIIKPTENVAPGGFHVHLAAPAADGKFLFIQDELNADNGLRLLDIRDPANFKTVWVEKNPRGGNAPHNFVIRDNLLFAGWYNDGIKVFTFDVSNPEKPAVEMVGFQEVRPKTVIPRERYFDGVWGVRLDDCTVNKEKRICVYASDMSTGLIVLAYKP